MSSSGWPLIMVVWFLVAGAAALQSLSGFGFALMLMPVMTLLLGVRTAAPLVALFGFSLYVTNVFRLFSHLRWRDLLPMAAAGALGVPLGVYALTTVDERPISAVLGVLLLAYTGYALFQPQMVISLPRWAIWAAGFVGGVLGGAYNTSGPPVIICGRVSGWPRDEFRSTLQGFFLLTGLVTISSHFVAGHMNANVMRLYGLGLPALVVGVVTADRVDRQLNARAFHLIVNTLLMGMGASLLLRAM